MQWATRTDNFHISRATSINMCEKEDTVFSISFVPPYHSPERRDLIKFILTSLYFLRTSQTQLLTRDKRNFSKHGQCHRGRFISMGTIHKQPSKLTVWYRYPRLINLKKVLQTQKRDAFDSAKNRKRQFVTAKPEKSPKFVTVKW